MEPNSGIYNIKNKRQNWVRHSAVIQFQFNQNLFHNLVELCRKVPAKDRRRKKSGQINVKECFNDGMVAEIGWVNKDFVFFMVEISF